MKYYLTIPVKAKHIKIQARAKNKKFADAGLIEGGVNALFGGFKDIFTSKKSADAPRNQKIIDNRTGGMNLTYLLAILAIGAVVIVGAWVGFKKLKQAK